MSPRTWRIVASATTVWAAPRIAKSKRRSRMAMVAAPESGTAARIQTGTRGAPLSISWTALLDGPNSEMEPARGAAFNRWGGDIAKECPMSEAKTTTDHKLIRQWAEERGAKPTSVEGTGSKKEPGVLRLDFEPKDDARQEISWADFFGKFEKEKLAFLYQDRTADGSVSRFHKFVQR